MQVFHSLNNCTKIALSFFVRRDEFVQEYPDIPRKFSEVRRKKTMQGLCNYLKNGTLEPMSEVSADTHNSGYDNYAQNKTADQANYNKPLQIIGMAKKAGLLAVGSDSAQTAIRAGKTKLIVFASDTSPSSIKRVHYEADKSGVLSINAPYTKFEFSNIAGRGSPGTLAFLDLGLAEEFVKRLAAIDKTRYGEITGLIEKKAIAQIKNKTSKTSNANKADKTGKVGRADNRRAKI